MINASIVLYNHSPEELSSLIQALLKSKLVSKLFLVDNSSKRTEEFESFEVDYIFNGKNLGYGAAHNIAIRETIASDIDYHLVLNPDIDLQTDVLENIESFMNDNPDIGLLMPKVFFPNGEIQYLCKLLPTPFDLIFRRFLPKKWTKARRDYFELRKSGYSATMDVPYLSGSFMFMRSDALKKVGLFDERFFLYPEDIDLSRRIHKHFRTVFYPKVSIIHKHEQASYKNNKMLLVHITNMSKYFCKWGWIFDRERKEINKRTLEQLNLKN